MKKSNIDSTHLEKLFRPENISHLIQGHILQEITYDTETTDLDKKYTYLTQFAAVATDITGCVTSSVDIRFQVPEHIVMAPQAALITQSFPDAIHYGTDRDPPHIAAGKTAYYFKNIYRYLWDALEDTETIIQTRAKNDPIRAIQVDSNYETRFESIRIYTITDDQGVTHDLRLHNGGKSLSYRLTDEAIVDSTRIYHDLEGTRWRKIVPRSLTNGFNNMRADDSWIMMSAFTSGMADIIIPYLKENHLFRVDTRTLAKAAVTLNIQGENGVQARQAINTRTGRTYTSFGLGALMHANTRLAAPERGVTEGIRMPDGSLYDARLGHQSALYDVLATAALRAYIRFKDPEISRQIELNTDLEKLKNFLIGQEGFGLRPLRTFLRDNYPNMPQVHAGICININEDISERPQAVLARTDTDAMLSEYTYKGKHLLDMDVDELALMLKEQKGAMDAVFEIVDLRKAPAIFEGDLAFERGHAVDPDRHEANRVFVQSNKEFRERVMEAQAVAMESFDSVDDAPNPRMEEEVFTNFRDLKQLEIEGLNGEKTLISDDIHTHAITVLERARNIDYTLRKLLEPDPIEWSQDISHEWQGKILDEFRDKVKKAAKDLAKYYAQITLPEPDADFGKSRKKKDDGWDGESDINTYEKTANAVEYLWKLRASLSHAFNDYSLSYGVYDKFDQEIDFTNLVHMPEHIRQNRLATGEYKVKFEQLNYSSEKMMRLFLTAPGRMKWLEHQLDNINAFDELEEMTQWREYFKAVAALHLSGPPHLDVDDHPWMSAQKSLKEIERIRRNFKTGIDIRADEGIPGLWDVFVSDRPKAEAILDALEKHCFAMLKKYPLTTERLSIMGYDEKGWPIENIKYLIAANASVLVLDVPDELLTTPLNHLEIGNNLLPIIVPSDINLTQELATKDFTILLLGHESGRICLAAKPTIATNIKPDLHFSELYGLAQKRYVDSGVTFPDNKGELLWLKVERIPIETPISLRPVDPTLQAIKMPRHEDFEGTVSTVIGMRPHYITGMVLKDEGFTPIPGKARLQEILAGRKAANDNDLESGWEREVSIRSVRTLRLKEFREAIAASLKRQKSGHQSVELLSQADALRCGYASLEDMRTKVTHLFTDDDRSIDAPDSRLHIVTFDQVEKETTTFFDPAQRSVAAFAQPLAPQTQARIWDNPKKILKLS